MKQNLFGIAAVIAVAGLASLFTARRVEAQYSSPVKVMNSTSAPAITSRMDDPGRVPYQSVINGMSACGGKTFCIVNFPPVPAGHRLVVTQVAGAHFVSTGQTVNVTLEIGIAGPGGNLGQFNYSLVGASYVLPVTFYVDAGNFVGYDANITGGPYDLGPQFVILTGYMLDCSAAPCAAIAQ